MPDDHGQRNAAEHQTQRYSQLFQDVPDYWWFVLLLMIFLALCCDFAVLLIFGLPAFICSLKVRLHNIVTAREPSTTTKHGGITVGSVDGLYIHVLRWNRMKA